MNYLSLCSGIEAATVAWHPLGWRPWAFSEIEAFPSAVLSHHYPETPNLGDMTKFKEWPHAAIDLLVGGTPCQSFSVAGLRKGMDDPRGNLALTYCAMLDHFRPRWFVWENVPGVLSSNGGRDFGSFIGALADIGYGFAYRVLDAQYFGVAQRRRRVFVVGHLGNWQRPAAVLFERESLRRDTAPRREAGKEAAGAVRTGLVGGIDYENNAHRFDEPTGPLLKGSPTGGGRPLPAIVSYAFPGNWIGRQPHNGSNQVEPNIEHSPCLTRTDVHGVAHPVIAAFKGGQGSGAGGIGYSEHVEPTLPASDGGNRTPTLLNDMAVRRLTPVECERLQGFPDEYTNIPWRKQPTAPDGPRYKALGNSMAVPVMRWIGGRIAQVDAITDRVSP